jgi:hypothetical protein
MNFGRFCFICNLFLFESIELLKPKTNIMGNSGLANSVVILVVIIVLISIPLFLAWYFIHRAKFKERMFMMEKGIDIKDLNLTRKNPFQFPWLKIGITLVGISLGYFFIMILEIYFNIGAIHLYAIILLFAGLSMITANFIGNPNK